MASHHMARYPGSLLVIKLHIKTTVRKFPDLKWRHKDNTTPSSQKSSENKESKKQNYK